MKKICVICLIVLTGTLGFANSEEFDLYEYLYINALTQQDQLSLLQIIADRDFSGVGEFYAAALNRTVREYPNIRSATEKSYADDKTVLLASLLGQEKYTDAAGDLWRAFNAFSDPLVKAELLMALGKMRAVDYLPQVIRVLNDLNRAPSRDRLSSERVAFGAIISLEKYGDISGYLPVYFAAIGWYSNRITDQAENSLAVICDDPTDHMIGVITNSGSSFEDRKIALDTVNHSKVSGESKARAATIALAEGWRLQTTRVAELEQLRSMRKVAMRMIQANGFSDDSVYKDLGQSYDQFAKRAGGDRNEAFDVIATLRSIATEESAKQLAQFLSDLNTKVQRKTNTTADRDLAMAIIPAIGAIGNAVGRPALTAVTALSGNDGWPQAVITAARNALQQIP